MPDSVTIEVMNSENRHAWRHLRRELWPDSDESDAHAWEQRTDASTFLAIENKEGRFVGFVEVGRREYADGCETSPIAFLEGWYVLPTVRGRGVGMQLIEAAKAWALTWNYEELASDSLLDDSDAYKAHLAVGFAEVERSVKYRMTLR